MTALAAAAASGVGPGGHSGLTRAAIRRRAGSSSTRTAAKPGDGRILPGHDYVLRRTSQNRQGDVLGERFASSAVMARTAAASASRRGPEDPTASIFSSRTPRSTSSCWAAPAAMTMRHGTGTSQPPQQQHAVFALPLPRAQAIGDNHERSGGSP